MNKKSLYLIMALATIFVTIIIIISIIFIKNKNIQSANELEMGEIKIEFTEPTSYEELDEDFEGYEVVQYAMIENIEVVYDYIPIRAVYDINVATTTYLNEHGYANVKRLHIIEDSILGGKEYPCFKLNMEGVDNKLLEIRYDVVNACFEFAIL